MFLGIGKDMDIIYHHDTVPTRRGPNYITIRPRRGLTSFSGQKKAGRVRA